GQFDALGYGMAYSPDGKMLASGGGFEVRFWDATSGAQLKSVQTDVFVFKLIWSPNSKLVAVVGDTISRAPIIDVAAGKVISELQTPQGNVLWAAAFSPDG